MDNRYLYKAKRTDNGEWVEGYYMPRPNLPNGYKHYIVTVGSCKWYEVDPSTICACTGLKDKNGKMIWKNDIVRQYADCSELGNDLYFFYRIKWDETYARFYGEEIYCGEQVLFDDLEDVEVIGSAIDNPELLEVEGLR